MRGTRFLLAMLAAVLAAACKPAMPSWNGTRLGIGLAAFQKIHPDAEPAQTPSAEGFTVEWASGQTAWSIPATGDVADSRFVFMGDRLRAIQVSFKPEAKAAEVLAQLTAENGPPDESASAAIASGAHWERGGGEVVFFQAPQGIKLALLAKDSAGGFPYLGLVVALCLMSIANGLAYGVKAKAFSDRVKAVEREEHLAQMRVLAVWNRWAARAQLAIMVPSLVLFVVGYHTDAIGFSGLAVFIGLNVVTYLAGKWIKGIDTGIRALPVSDPALQPAFDAVVADMKKGARGSG